MAPGESGAAVKKSHGGDEGWESVSLDLGLESGGFAGGGCVASARD